MDHRSLRDGRTSLLGGRSGRPDQPPEGARLSGCLRDRHAPPRTDRRARRSFARGSAEPAPLLAEWLHLRGRNRSGGSSDGRAGDRARRGRTAGRGSMDRASGRPASRGL